MKRYIVIGLGNFGATLAAKLHTLGVEVIAVDRNAAAVDGIAARVSRALVADATNKAALDEAGARGADAAIISMGEELAASILALLAVRDLGVKTVFVKVGSEEHARIADALGADESIFPERESALALASRVTAGALLKYVQFGPNLSIQEMAVPGGWRGKTLRELGLPQQYRAQVIAVHDVLRDLMIPAPDPDRPLTESDALLVAGEPAALETLARLS